MDRLTEAIIDNSYGAVSLSWDVDIAPTVYIPYDYPADSPFAYHQNPTTDYLSKNQINMATDYHTAIVSARCVSDPLFWACVQSVVLIACALLLLPLPDICP
jgi:hypothetical protein